MLDGNAIAGMMTEVFGSEMTTATATCAGCGASGMLAETRVYLRAPGTVVRCPHCQSVMVVVVERRGAYCVDMQGVIGLSV